MCPQSLDRCCAPIDDALIKCGQSCARKKRLRKPMSYLAYFFTCTTIVEIGPIFPIVLYGCFLDDIALVSLVVMAAVVLLSQIPKRSVRLAVWGRFCGLTESNCLSRGDWMDKG